MNKRRSRGEGTIYQQPDGLWAAQITPAHLRTLYSQKLKDGLSKRTVKYIHTIMHQMLDVALKWGLVARNVSDALDAPHTG